MDELLQLLPTCGKCGAPAVGVRRRANPPWGFDDNGLPHGSVQPLLSLLLEWLGSHVDLDDYPDEIQGVCSDHLLPDRPSPPAAPTNWMERRRAEKRKARQDILTELGGRCETCRHVRPDEEMRVIVPERNRLDFGITNRSEWYRFILARPVLLAQTRLLCATCVPIRPGPQDPGRDARAQVLEAYGNRCWSPDCPRTDGLMIAALPGTSPLRWPGGVKYGSVAKAEYLIRNKFPAGWTLSCGRHLAGLRKQE